jgi:carboxyl-terminal processing protease
MRRSLVAAAVVAAFTLTGCPDNGGIFCDEQTRKEDVLSITESWYLFQDLLPAKVKLSDYATADDLLAALTAEAQLEGKDRGWSFLMPEDQYLAYFGAGQSIGYGFSILETGAAPSLQVFVKQVFAGSAADGAGFVRGDEILEVGPDASSMTVVAGLTADELAALISANGVAGVSKVFQVQPAGGGAPAIRTMTSAAYSVDPVPSHWVQGTTGYVQLRTFIAPAENALRSAFADFKTAGVQGVVVDLRYNGGGSLDTAMVLADLLGADQVGHPMFDIHFNDLHVSSSMRLNFEAETDGGAFQRIAFITTSASASASELVPNALDPYRSSSTIAYVGGTTYGKPVGQQVWELTGCNTVLFLVSFALQNSAGDAGYYTGLPDDNSKAPLCDALDDLAHPQDSVDEASTAAAVYFVEHGACPRAAPGLRSLAAAKLVDQMVGRGSGPAGRDMAGTF